MKKKMKTDRILEEIEFSFSMIFIGEMCLKIFALGVSGIQIDGNEIFRGYFSNAWNRFDFFVVVMSILSSIWPNVNAIRLMRLMRPLRTVSQFKSLRILVRVLIGSLQGLFEVFILMCFLLIIFAIIGVQLFKGVLHNR